MPAKTYLWRDESLRSQAVGESGLELTDPFFCQCVEFASANVPLDLRIPLGSIVGAESLSKCRQISTTQLLDSFFDGLNIAVHDGKMANYGSRSTSPFSPAGFVDWRGVDHFNRPQFPLRNGPLFRTKAGTGRRCDHSDSGASEWPWHSVTV